VVKSQPRGYQQAIGVYIFVMCLALFGAVPIFFPIATNAQGSITADQESYLDRPDILQVSTKAHNMGANWEALKKAHFAFVAELLELYSPDTQFYFLARDSEYLFDTARLVTEGTQDSKRIHLLNVSRGNMRDKNIKKYLAENGISDEGLSKGKKVLFVDTGFAGTIPGVIAENFSQDLRSQLKTHLIVSNNSQHPSSRVFLYFINPAVNDQSPASMHSTIVSYEHMPRYTDRSNQFSFQGGLHHPVSAIGGAADGTVSKEQALRYMEDLRATWQRDEAKLQAEEMRELFRSAKALLVEGDDSAKEKIKDELAKNDGLFEASVRDLMGARLNAGLSITVQPENLGLKNTTPSGYSKKLQYIEKYPQWKSILEDPVVQMPEVFKKKSWQLIGNLIDANIDAEIQQSLLEHLFSAPAQGLKKDLQKSVIEKGDQQVLGWLAQNTFSQDHTKDMTDLLRLVIEKGDQEVLRRLSADTFSKVHTKDMTDLIRLVIEKGNQEVLRDLSIYTFSKGHTKDMTNLLRLVIERGNESVLLALVVHNFSKAHTKDMTDLIRLVIEKGDQKVLAYLAIYTFSKAYTNEMTDLLRLVIEKGDQQVLIKLAEYVFSKAYTKDMTDLIRLAIEKSAQGTLAYIKENMPAALKSDLPKVKVLKKSLEIMDDTERKAFLELEFQKHKELSKTGSVAKKLSAVKNSKIAPDLKPGEQVQIQKQRFEILSLVVSGRRGVVFKVRSKNQIYALKVAKNQEADTLESLAKESSKAKKWNELQLPHAKVLVQAKDFVLKEWVEGTNGDEIIKKYAEGDESLKPVTQELLLLVDKIRGQGAYIGDFRPANLIWTGSQWVIIDSDGIQDGMTVEEAHLKWSSADHRGPKFQRRWRLPIPSCKASLL